MAYAINMAPCVHTQLRHSYVYVEDVASCTRVHPSAATSKNAALHPTSSDC